MGYDVWLGNARGNRFSREHLTLDPDVDLEEYWTHDWDTVGIYDLPAMFDYVTRTTGAEKVFYASHSMGGTAFLVAMSEKPEVQDKVKAAFLMAPPTWAANQPDFMVSTAQFIDARERLLERLGKQLFSKSSLARKIVFELCRRTEQPSLTFRLVGGSTFGLWPLFHLRDGGKWPEMIGTQYGGTLRH
jgi:pimeloyl-ACP methyl ester carboxylesterase